MTSFNKHAEKSFYWQNRLCTE